MNSSCSDDGGRPDEASTRRTQATKPGSRNCRADTFTLTYSGGCLGHLPLPAGGVSRSPLQHPGTERDDLAGLLGQRHELVRVDHAPLWVWPPHQGLEPDDLAAAESHDGLVRQGERRTGHRIVERRPHVALPGRGVWCPAPACSRPHCRFPAAFAPLRTNSARLTTSNRLAPSSVVATPTVTVVVTEPAGEREGLGESLDDRGGHGVRRRAIDEILQDQRKLIIARPRRGASAARHRREPACRGHQELVAEPRIPGSR